MPINPIPIPINLFRVIFSFKTKNEIKAVINGDKLYIKHAFDDDIFFNPQISKEFVKYILKIVKLTKKK